MQNNKVCRDASDQRGRWKTIKTNKKSRASNIYHKSFLRFLDLEAASGLCEAGCCYYVVEGLTAEMVKNILPASKHLISGVGFILCCAALWAYANERDLLPDALIARIEKFQGNLLPVKRVQVVADDEEFIDFDEDVHRATTQSDDRKLLNKLIIGQESLKRKLVDQSITSRENFKKLKRMTKSLTTRVDRVVLYNTRSRTQSNTGPAEIYDCQSLHEYWVEHEFGIAGNKATKLFTKEETRKNKHKLCLRKKLVDAVKFLLPHTPATVACQRLESVYRFDGRKSGCLRDIGQELKKTPRLPKYFEKYPSPI